VPIDNTLRLRSSGNYLDELFKIYSDFETSQLVANQTVVIVSIVKPIANVVTPLTDSDCTTTDTDLADRLTPDGYQFERFHLYPSP
jgi:hypothetical protein